MTQHHRIDRFRFDVALVADGADRAHAAALQDRLTERWHFKSNNNEQSIFNFWFPFSDHLIVFQ